MSFRIWTHWALVTLGVIDEDEFLDGSFKINDIIAKTHEPISTFLNIRNDFIAYCKDTDADPIWDLEWPFH